MSFPSACACCPAPECASEPEARSAGSLPQDRLEVYHLAVALHVACTADHRSHLSRALHPVCSKRRES